MYKLMIEYIKAALRLVLWGGSCVFPRRRTKLVFGAWGGKSYSDNAKYVFEHFFNKVGFRIVWVGNEEIRESLPPLPQNASFVRRGSLSAYWHLLTAKYWVFTHSGCDFSVLPIYGNAIFLNVNHGSFGIKKYGDNRACISQCCREHSRMLDGLNALIKPGEKFFLTGNHIVMEHYRNAYPGLFDSAVELPFGTATLDFLIANKNNQSLKRELRQQIAKRFGLPLNKKWIIYAPTFRWTRNDNFSFCNLSGDSQCRLEKVLSQMNAVIVEKLHPNCLLDDNAGVNESKFVFSIHGKKALQLDQNYLWLIADVCISDYSAAIYLSYFAGNPVVHFAYDLEFYENQDTGLAYSLEDVRVGPIAHTTEELIGILSSGVMRQDIDKVGKQVEVLFEYEKGKACEQIEVFLRHHMRKRGVIH